MNFLFDGKHKQRRAIDLRGNKSHITSNRDDLLKSVHDAREAVAVARRKEKAALTIQSCWRSHNTRKHSIYALYILKIKAYITQQPIQYDFPQFLFLLSSLFRFEKFNVSEKDDRINLFCLVLDSLTPANIMSYLNAIHPPEQLSRLQFSLVSFGKLLLNSIADIKETKIGSKTLPEDKLVISLSTILLPQLFIHFPEANKVVMQQVGIRLFKSNWFHLWRRAILHTHDKNLMSQLTLLLLLPFHSFYVGGMDAQVRFQLVEDFIKLICTIPQLPSKIGLQAIGYFNTQMPFDDCLSFLYHVVVEMEKQNNGSSEEFLLCDVESNNPLNKSGRVSLWNTYTAVDELLVSKSGFYLKEAVPGENVYLLSNTALLLCNLAVFGNPRIGSWSGANLLNYLFCISRLCEIADIPDSIILQQDLSRIDIEDDEDDNESVKTDEKFLSILRTVYKPIQALIDRKPTSTVPRLLNGLSKMVLHKEEILLSSISRFFLTIIVKWPRIKDDILRSIDNTLLSSVQSETTAELGTVKLVRLIWNYLSSTKTVQSSKESFSYSLISDMSLVNFWILVTLGDEELLDQQIILSKSDLLDATLFLRNVVFTLYWEGKETSHRKGQTKGSKKLTSVENMQKMLTEVILQIYHRDSRRTFCPTGFWVKRSNVDIAALGRGQNFLDAEEESTPPLARANSFFSSRSALRNSIASSNTRDVNRNNDLPILKNIPFMIPFEERVQIFRNLIYEDRSLSGNDNFFGGPSVPRATVHRTNIFLDGFNQLNSLRSKMKSRLQISFISELGIEEAGIDGGGVFKEFLNAIVTQSFNPHFGLFTVTPDQLLYPNPAYLNQFEGLEKSTVLEYFSFVGRVIGKALYEGILVADIRFAGFFLSKWLGRTNYFDDLPSLDPELYRNLLYLKHFKGDFNDLMLDFTLGEHLTNGKTVARDLIPGGQNEPVTKENKLRYIYLTCNYKLNLQIQQQCNAFFDGLSDLINPRWLKLFNQQELQILISGASVPIDLNDLRHNTVYDGLLYNDTSPVIENFWTAVGQFTDEQKRSLLRFATSCSRPPLLGFKELNPLFSIRHGGNDQTRLPTASVCSNLLKLPAYKSAEILREKLLQAIENNTGFELS